MRHITKIAYILNNFSSTLNSNCLSGFKLNYKNSSSFKSALYVYGSKSPKMPFVVSPNSDFDSVFNDMKELQHNLNSRGMQLDIKTLKNTYEKFKALKAEIKTIEDEKDVLNEQMKVYIKTKTGTKKEIETLHNISRDLREKVKLLYKMLEDVEEVAMLGALQLPNVLHPATPKGNENIILDLFGEKKLFPFKLKNHIHVGEISDTLSFIPVGPKAYYLKGIASEMEFGLSRYVLNKCKEMGFQALSPYHLYKAVVAEGCGIDFNDPKNIFLLQLRNETSVTTNLLVLSGISLIPFAAYHVRTDHDFRELPLKYCAAGRNYAPVIKEEFREDLYDIHQSNRIDIFGATENNDGKCEILFENFKDFIRQVYEELELPCRVVQVASKHLHFTEMQKLSFEVWLPYSQKFIPAGHLTMLGNFISKRLKMRYVTESKTPEYLNIVYGCVFSFPPLLASIMENRQTSDGYFTIPDNLKL